MLSEERKEILKGVLVAQLSKHILHDADCYCGNFSEPNFVGQEAIRHLWAEHVAEEILD